MGNWIKANSIKTETLEYDGHFMVDVKQTMNLTSPDVIVYYEKEEPISVLKKLGVIHKEILKLKPEGEKRISKVVIVDQAKKTDKIEVEYLKDAAGVKKGTIKRLPRKLAYKVIELGVVKAL